MSLDDRFNPKGKDPIDKIDHVLFSLNKKLAEKWQDKTGHSKRVLEDILYSVSFAALGAYTLEAGPLMAIPTIHSGLKAAYPSFRPRSTIEEQMTAEMLGFPSKISKFISHALYLTALSGLVDGGVRIVAGMLGADIDYSEAIRGIDYSKAIRNLTFGIGVLAWVTADYMAKADIDEPPPKKPILERLKAAVRSLIPRPATTYSTAPTYS